MTEVILTDANFEAEVLKSDVPVLVDFWAAWCGPCKIMEPIIEKLAEAYAGKPVKIAKLNVDENQATAGSYGIMSIPTFLFFKSGQVVEQTRGVQPEDVMKKKIDAVLAS